MGANPNPPLIHKNTRYIHKRKVIVFEFTPPLPWKENISIHDITM